MPTPSPKMLRTRRANGRDAIDGRSARGRRLRELLAIYSIGVDMEDAKAAALVKNVVTLSIQLETLEDDSDIGRAIDRLELVRLSNARGRAEERLEALKAKAHQAPAESSAAGLSALQRHLERLAAEDKPSSKRQ
jgi:hypothetical protein